MLSRWIHRRAVLAFLLLPWLTLLLALAGLALLDHLLGDQVISQQWALEPHRELLRQLGVDLLWLVGALYLLGTLPWLGGLLLGGGALVWAAVLLVVLCGTAGIGLGLFAGLKAMQPQSLLLGAVCALSGLLYALATHREPPPPPRGLPRSRFDLPDDGLPPAPPPTTRPSRVPPPLPVLTDRHEAPTTIPAEH